MLFVPEIVYVLQKTNYFKMLKANSEEILKWYIAACYM